MGLELQFIAVAVAVTVAVAVAVAFDIQRKVKLSVLAKKPTNVLTKVQCNIIRNINKHTRLYAIEGVINYRKKTEKKQKNEMKNYFFVSDC